MAPPLPFLALGCTSPGEAGFRSLSPKSLGGARRQSVQPPTSLAPQRSLALEPGFPKPLTPETQDAGMSLVLCTPFTKVPGHATPWSVADQGSGLCSPSLCSHHSPLQPPESPSPHPTPSFEHLWRMDHGLILCMSSTSSGPSLGNAD